MTTVGELKGFQKDRLIDRSDNFDCLICFCIARNPLECLKCGQIYCKHCQDSWKQSDGTYLCLKCEGSRMNPLNQHLMEGYSQLKYRCVCNQVFCLQDISKHEEYCSLPNCKYYSYCNLKVSPQFKKQQVCSSVCLILDHTQQNIKDQNKLYMLIMGTLNKLPAGYNNNNSANQMVVSKSNAHINKSDIVPQIPQIPYIQIKNSFPTQLQFKWDQNNKGEGILIQNDGYQVRLKENVYVFKSVISDQPFTKGQHYFELAIDSFTENELKIGVVTNNTFNKNTAFCDQESGYGYYTIGKLRNGSNAHGSNYGQKFKNSGVCGVYLDMNQGILAFSYNGVSLGVAFRTNILTKSPIYASVSLLHCAGFTLRSGLNIPAWANGLS